MTDASTQSAVQLGYLGLCVRLLKTVQGGEDKFAFTYTQLSFVILKCGSGKQRPRSCSDGRKSEDIPGLTWNSAQAGAYCPGLGVSI